MLTAVERFDGRVLLRPEESHQLMYSVRSRAAAAVASSTGGVGGLAPAEEAPADEGEGRFGEGSHTLGRVEVCWRTTTGESGSVRSGPVVFEGPDRPEVEVRSAAILLCARVCCVCLMDWNGVFPRG